MSKIIEYVNNLLFTVNILVALSVMCFYKPSWTDALLKFLICDIIFVTIYTIIVVIIKLKK